jgi:hypothetical protein
MFGEQWNIGLSLFKKFLKKIGIEKEGTVVKVTYIFDFEDEKLAKAFAEGMKRQSGIAETPQAEAKEKQ